ncbi:hypothetical protein TWF970_004223 [Orbilia oligospora]|uniref:Uncharacterized protein n=1 Tax=Orbilia oligospora TaxID=2813651 RepID=A0A7C8R8B8_ORBOL|nr:hypothetical protein TWF970_004223 [Orbilia oligospora]
MSGAEFVAVAAVASSIIAIIDGMAKVVEAALDAEGLPKAFRRASQKLEIISDILDATRTTLESHNSSQIDSAAKKTIDRCEEDWNKLKELFNKVVPEDKSSRMERYTKAARTLGKGGKVETLMKNLLENVQLLATFKIMTENGREEAIASEADKKKLDRHIADVTGWEPSLPDSVFEEGGYNMNVSGSGNFVVQGESSRQNNLQDRSQYFEVRGDYHAGTKPLTPEEINQLCLSSLKCPDTPAIKNRLKMTKDKLVIGSMDWILTDPQFLRWKAGDELSLLWIKGGAGKGKTMTAIGLIEELSRSNGSIVAYSFCQDSNYELNTVEAIIKGLIRCFVNQRNEAMMILRRLWDSQNDCFIDGVPTWQTLWDIFLEMLLQTKSPRVYLVIDALDECQEGDMAEFLQLLVRTGLDNPSKIKWLLTSRPFHIANQELLAGSDQELVSLELNFEHVSAGVAIYIIEKVAELDRRHHYGQTLRQEIEKQLTARAKGIYMWVSLVCKRLEGVSPDEALATIEDSPPGLFPFYNRALKQLGSGRDSMITRSCIRLLRVAALTFSVLSVDEVESVSGLDLSGERITITMLLDMCTSFLSLRDQENKLIGFVHQSARDYLNTEEARLILEGNGAYGHREIVLTSLSYLSRNLKINVVDLAKFKELRPLLQPGKLEDRLAGVKTSQYAARTWVHHLAELDETTLAQVTFSRSDGEFSSFCHNKLLQWLECMCIVARVTYVSGILDTLAERYPISRFESRVPLFVRFIHDTRSFISKYGPFIQDYPLQVYAYAMAFTPETSLLRGRNLDKAPTWLGTLPQLQRNHEYVSLQPRSQRFRKQKLDHTWRKNRETLGADHQPKFEVGQPRDVHKVVRFSPDGKQIASRALSNKTVVQLWDSLTGGPHKSLVGHLYPVKTIAYSSDGKLIASGSENIKVWDTVSGELQITLCDSSNTDLYIRAVAFSPDGDKIASASDYGNLQIWDTKAGTSETTIKAHSRISTVSFSPNGKYIVSGSYDGHVKVWNSTTGEFQRQFDTVYPVTTVAFSPSGKHIAAGDCYGEFHVWDTPAFSGIGKMFNVHLSGVVGFVDSFTVKEVRSLYGYLINYVIFSHDGEYLITNVGHIRVKRIPARGKPPLSPYAPIYRSFQHFGVRGDWLCYGTEEVLRIPFLYSRDMPKSKGPYREPVTSCDIRGDQIVMKLLNGSILRVTIDQKKLAIPLEELLNKNADWPEKPDELAAWPWVSSIVSGLDNILTHPGL